MNVGRDRRGKRKEKRGNRLFGAVMLALMAVLTVGAVVQAEDNGGSYSLLIKKRLDLSGITSETDKTALLGQTYTFKVTGTKGKDKTPVEKNVTIDTFKEDGIGTAEVSFDEPFVVSTIELIGRDNINVNGWMVTEPVYESAMAVNNGYAILDIDKDGGKIKIEKPIPDYSFKDDVSYENTYRYRITGTDFNSGSIIYDHEVDVPAGGSTELTGLSRGYYQIEEQKAQSGFSLTVERKGIKVAPGTGPQNPARINGESGRITIYASTLDILGLEDVQEFTIEGPDKFEETFSLKKGETFVRDNLKKGQYTITEQVYEGNPGNYKVTVPQVTTKNRSERSSAISTTTSLTTKYFSVGGDYIDGLTYGPLYSESGKVMSSNVTYKFGYGALNPNDLTQVKRWAMNKAVKGNTSGNKVDLSSNDIVRMPASGRLYVGTKEVSDPNAKYLGVSWTEYTINGEKTYNCPDSKVVYQAQIDERGWITITKPEDTNDPSRSVTYTYTISDQTGSTWMVDLKAGESETLTGLASGKVTVKEELRLKQKGGYTMDVVDNSFTENVNAQLMGFTREEAEKNIFTLEKRPCASGYDDGQREYYFKIDEPSGDSHIVKLKAGEKKTLREMLGLPEATRLEKGEYSVQAIDGAYTGFHLTYNDSCTVAVVSSTNAEVTVTNSFTKANGFYRIVHEYYYDDGSGRPYKLEGKSDIEKINVQALNNEQHTYKTVTRIPNHGGHIYGYDGAAYGKMAGDNGYSEDPSKEYVIATEKGEEIIILKYVRRDNDTTGSYKIVHEYYLRDSEGDHLEGISQIEQVTRQELRSEHFAKDVTQEPYFTLNGQERLYTYFQSAYGKMKDELGYEADTAKDRVYATMGGEEIIILRYYRYPAYYNVVHEYYIRSKRVEDGAVDAQSFFEEETIEEILETIEPLESTEGSSEQEMPVDQKGPSEEDPPMISEETDEQIFPVTPEESSEQISTSIPEESSEQISPTISGGSSEQETSADWEESGEQGTSANQEESGERESTGHEGSDEQTSPAIPENTEGKEPPIIQETMGGQWSPIRPLDPEPRHGDGSRTRSEADIRIASLALSMMSFSTTLRTDSHIDSEAFKIPIARGLEDDIMDVLVDETEDSQEPFDESDGIEASDDEDDDDRTIVESGNVGISDDEDDDIGTPSNALHKTKVRSNVRDSVMDPINVNSRISSVEEEEDIDGSDGADKAEDIGGDMWVYQYVGSSEIVSIDAAEDSEHYAEMVELQTRYRSNEYIHDPSDLEDGYGFVGSGYAWGYQEDAGKTSAIATADGEQIIILRYYRDTSTPDGPDKPDETDPTPPPPGGGGGRHHRDPDPDPTPPSTTAPDPTSEQPIVTIDENPGYPTELPDPNDPNSPDRITIWENGVPKTYVKVWNPETGMWEYILEEEVPLSSQDLPKTGDKSRNVLWMTLFIGSVVGILWLIAVKRKQRA